MEINDHVKVLIMRDVSDNSYGPPILASEWCDAIVTRPPFQLDPSELGEDWVGIKVNGEDKIFPAAKITGKLNLG